MIDIVIPTYGRPDRLRAVVDDARNAAAVPTRVLLVVEQHDDESIAAAHDALPDRVIVNDRRSCYAGAINAAMPHIRSTYWFAGADDLHFHPGWDHAALTRADDQFMVIGTNDLGNPYVLAGTHATHFLVDHRYILRYGGTLDCGPGIAMFEGYHHQFTDTEFIGLAKARVRFAPCLDAVVEHNHYLFGKSPHDATYERAYAELGPDEALYNERKRSWENLSR